MMNKAVRITLTALGLVAVGVLVVYAGTASAGTGLQGTTEDEATTIATQDGPTCRRLAQAMRPGIWGGPWASRVRGLLARHPLTAMRLRNQAAEAQAELEISPEEALEIAQSYLDENQPGAVAEPIRNPVGLAFYHFRILVDDELVGGLTINGHSGEVFEHPEECPWVDPDSSGDE